MTPKSVLGEGEAPEKPSLSHPNNVAADGEVGSDVSPVPSSSQLVPTSVSIELKKKKKRLRDLLHLSALCCPAIVFLNGPR